MNILFTLVSAVSFMFLFVNSIVILIERQVHKEMTIDYSKQWDYGTYEQFRRRFVTHKWEISSNKRGLTDYTTGSEFYASIIRFNGNGMVLGPIDFFRAKRLAKKYIGSSRSVGLWPGETTHDHFLG